MRPVAHAAGHAVISYSREFGVRATVREERVCNEVRFGNLRLTDLARAIGTGPQSFKRTIDVVQRGFDSGHAFVVDLSHGTTLPASGFDE